MQRRLIILGILALLQMLWLLTFTGIAVGDRDYEAYVAQQGETIASIAADYGIAADALAKANRMSANDPLQTGQLIVIPNLPQAALSDPGQAVEAEATTASGDKVRGKLAVVIAVKLSILAQPGTGRTLYENVERGTPLLAIGTSGDYYAVLMSNGSTGFVLKKLVGLSEKTLEVNRPTAPAAPAQPVQSPVVETAFRYLDTRYRLGGTLPYSVDCSLLVQTAFAKNGTRLPRTAAQQFQVGQPVQVPDLQSGDRLYFYNRAGNIGHTGIYIGNGRFIHASSNRGKVAVDDLANPTYWSKFAGARR